MAFGCASSCIAGLSQCNPDANLETTDIISFLFTLYAAKPLADTDSLQNPSITPPAILNAPNSAGNTALHWAALNGHVSTILLLLSYGADPSVLNKAGHDALYEAEINEKSEAVDLLLREGNGLEEVVHGSGEDEEEEEAIKAFGAEEDGIGESQTDQGLGKGKEIDGLTEKVEKLNTEI